MTTAAEVLKTIRDNDVRYVDFRFTDPRGKWQHVTFDVSLIDEEIFDEGTMFDAELLGKRLGGHVDAEPRADDLARLTAPLPGGFQSVDPDAPVPARTVTCPACGHEFAP